MLICIERRREADEGRRNSIAATVGWLSHFASFDGDEAGSEMRMYARVGGAGRRLLQSRWGINVALLAVMYLVYLALRYTILENVEATAFRNADAVIALERATGTYWEPNIQQWALEHAHWAVVFFNWSYTLGLFPIILPVAVLMFFRWPKTFSYYRDVFLISMVLTWVIYAAFPLAPPRLMVGEGFVDSVALYGPDLYSSRESKEFYNAFSAMPSMHFGWPMLYGVVFWRTGRRLLRVLAVAYPALIFAAVVVTANHYFLDPIVGGLVVVASFRLRRLLLGGEPPLMSEAAPPEPAE
jgi:hypothetical protein